MRAIAEQTGRSPSTISRELRRNRDPGSGQYRPFTAHKLAVRRRARPRPGKIAGDEVLRQFVAERLAKRWSPEQISRALRAQVPGRPGAACRARDDLPGGLPPELGGLSRELPARVLRSGRRRRRPHPPPGERRPNGITAVTMIDQRPAEAAGRQEPGHWEGDLITGASNRSAIGSLVDRASRYTVLLHLPGRHTAEAVRDALITAFCQLPPPLRRSLTWDQGKEMALHQEVTATLGMPVYFCDKASPWQRPSNENTNGLLRQYFPKGSDLRVHGLGDLAAVAAELNARPRKTLGWDTPAGRLGL